MTCIEEAKCSLCGVKRTCAVWHGAAGHIYCCHACAEKDLPRLIADAIWLKTPDSPYESARRAWARGEGAFWKAIASRLSHGKTV